MPIFFILGLLFFFGGIFMLVKGKVSDGPDEINLRPWSAIPFGIFLLITFFSTVQIVDPGHVAVPVTWGSTGSPMEAGVKFVNPFAELHSMNVQTQEYTMTATQGEGDIEGNDSIEVKGSDGATARVDATVLYHLNPKEAARVYRELGDDYVEKLIRPSIRTCIRDGFADFPMLDAATSARGEVQVFIDECLNEKLTDAGFVVEDFQLRNVAVGEAIEQAIEAKVAAQQQAEAQVYELQKETAAAEKQRIKAQGLADAEQIIKCGATTETTTNAEGEEIEVAVPKDGADCENNLTQEYLQYQYIQALKELVDSPNNSTVILPFDQELTPILPVTPGG